ncbi:hypothetical protein LMH73_007310 [Vibrio splendidus]|nr:hypothetical protein [Vibrio splendidus]MCC4883139.1 hypothetical protein [Vibrio splendidus]
MQKKQISSCSNVPVQLEYTTSTKTLAIVFKDKKSVYDVLTNVINANAAFYEALEAKDFETLVLSSVSKTYPSLNASIVEYQIVFGEPESKSGAMRVCTINNQLLLIENFKNICATAGINSYFSQCISRLSMGLEIELPVGFTSELTSHKHVESNATMAQIPTLFGLSSASLNEILNLMRSRLECQELIDVDWVHGLISAQASKQNINNELTKGQLFVISQKLFQLA